MRIFLIVTGIFWAFPSLAAPAFCNSIFAKYLDQEEFGRKLQQELEHSSLFTLKPLPSDLALKRNQNLLELLLKLPRPQTLDRLSGVTYEQANELLRKITANPIAGLNVPEKNYDFSGKIGFCFGRALAIHLEALRFGVHKDSILKIWSVGTLSTGSYKWRYHVATMVRSNQENWYVLDPIMDEVLTLPAWYHEMQKSDPTQTMSLFFTEAKRFIPDSSEAYSREGLSNTHYSGYFLDLMEYFRNESQRQNLMSLKRLKEKD